MNAHYNSASLGINPNTYTDHLIFIKKTLPEVSVFLCIQIDQFFTFNEVNQS